MAGFIKSIYLGTKVNLMASQDPLHRSSELMLLVNSMLSGLKVDNHFHAGAPYT